MHAGEHRKVRVGYGPEWEDDSPRKSHCRSPSRVHGLKRWLRCSLYRALLGAGRDPELAMEIVVACARKVFSWNACDLQSCLIETAHSKPVNASLASCLLAACQTDPLCVLRQPGCLVGHCGASWACFLDIHCVTHTYIHTNQPTGSPIRPPACDHCSASELHTHDPY